MSDLWEHSERVSCVHPGWPALHGWGSVAASWVALFAQPSPVQFVLTRTKVFEAGDTAWVTVDENLLDGGRTVAALNVFVHDGTAWRMVAHHGSVVVARTQPG